MDEAHNLLGLEIDRILDSPYPTQLKSLRDLVTSKCSDADINKCLQTRPCRVDQLARCLLEGLQRWPYVLDIIAKMSRNVRVRDALVEYEPTLIHQLVSEAVKPESLRSKSAAATVSMLSHRLPSNIALPSGVQTLFLRLVEHAAHKPSTAALQPVHALLTGTSSMLLGLLAHQTLRDFEEKVFQILHHSTRRPPTEEDPLLTLYCLALMKIVTSAAEDSLVLTNSLYQTQELLASTQPTSPKWHATEMQKFFSSSTDAPRTINLLCLKAMWACATSAESLQVRLEALSLVGDLVAAVPAEIKDLWCSSNSALLQKIQQKALACSAGSALQLKAFAFITQLCKPVDLQMASIETARSSVSSMETLVDSYDQDSGTAWTTGMNALADSSTALALASEAVELVTAARPSQLLKQSAALGHALRTVSALVEDRHDIAEAGLMELASSKMVGRVQQLTDQIKSRTWKETAHDADLSVCRGAYLNARNSIAQELSAFLIQCLLGRQEVEARGIAPSTGALLLELHALSASSRAPCPHHTRMLSSSGTAVTFAEDDRSNDTLCSDWRETLHNHLGHDASMKEAALKKLFAKACEDLEKRCEGVEEPLRLEREARAHVQDLYGQLQESYARLESECIDGKLRYESAVGEKDDLITEMDALQQRADELVGRAQELEEMLRSSRAESDQKLERLQKVIDAAQLEHATAFASKEEDFEELEMTNADLHKAIDCTRRELEEVNRELRTLRDAKDVLEAEKRALQAEHEGLLDDHQRLDEQVEDMRVAMNGREQCLRDADLHREALEAGLAAARDELANERRAREQQLQQERAFAKENIQAANASHNNTMDRLAIQHGEEAAGLHRRLSDLREQMQRAEDRHRAELWKKDDEADEAQKQLGRLQRRLKQKDQQIQQANAMRQNLMAAMGLGGSAQQPSLPHRARASVARSQQLAEESQREGQPTPPSPTSASLEDSLLGWDPRASSITSGESRRGSTPKRAGAKQSFKASSPAKTRRGVSARTRGSASVVGSAGGGVGKRGPLREMSANRSPRKLDGNAGLETPSRKAGPDGDEFDGSPFDEGGLFDGTGTQDVPTALRATHEDEETEV